ncbi:Integral membrane protein TerC family [Musa troglodytarum]|uniref:Integral membrane protein TerC family n=1 Tax=Musa troglodytarum TaxID=320322 RepID=A0A9E7GN96_9LILI|nr:Integral membrane protein TerC family [Musa troglodytarum]
MADISRVAAGCRNQLAAHENEAILGVFGQMQRVVVLQRCNLLFLIFLHGKHIKSMAKQAAKDMYKHGQATNDYYDGDRFFTIKDGVRKATPLLLTVAVIELSDIAFAVDSIPAVFGVTRDPFIVFSSNLFAICGLRSLYVLISESMSELVYLQPAIGFVLGFIGTKMLFDLFGYHVPTEVSLGFVAITLGAGVLLSIGKNQIE